MSSNRFLRTRVDHSKETAEDYLELIDSLIAGSGEARTVDLAENLAVSHVTVSKTLQRLQRDGYVTMQPYRSIFLTDLGKDLAESARQRHTLVYDFLIALGVDRETAETDAEGIEHHVSKQTLNAMQRHIDSRKL